MSRLATRDSNLSGWNGRGDRARSGSPSEYYRHQMGKKDQLFDKVQDLKGFIHDSIEKFLDKQAVRDLIIAYDSDDIFIRGEMEFFQTCESDLVRRDFITNEENEDETEEYQSKNYLTINNGLDRVSKFQNVAGKINEMSRSLNANQSKGLKKSGGNLPRRHSSLLTTFFSLVRIKLFKVHRNRSATRRRESEFFNQNMENIKRK